MLIFLLIFFIFVVILYGNSSLDIGILGLKVIWCFMVDKYKDFFVYFIYYIVINVLGVMVILFIFVFYF